MSLPRLLRILGQRLRALARKDAMDAELQRELAFHHELLVREHQADGLSLAEATRAARRSLGNVPLIEEQCRDHRRVTSFHHLRQDLVYGMRVLRRNPGFAAIAIASLAIGIGGNTAVFGVMDAVLRQQLAIPDDDRVVVARTRPVRSPLQDANASFAEYDAWRERSRSFDLLSASLGTQADFGDTGGLGPERVGGQSVTPELFEVLNVRPAIGRVFTAAELDRAEAPRVVVISYRLWQRRFGGVAGVVGRDVQINGLRTVLLGVMPEGFHYPNATVDYWMPMPRAVNPQQPRGPERFYVITGRLRPGATREQAQEDLNAIAAQLEREDPDRYAGWRVRVLALREAMYGWTRQPLLTLGGAVVLVLLVACANLAGLLLARGLSRGPELALRGALGASRSRIVRQLLTESLLLATAGGVLGVAVAWGGVRALAAITPPPGGVGLVNVTFSPAMLAWTAVFTMGTVVVFGIVPALAATRVYLTAALQNGPPHATHTRGTLRAVLVAAQVAVTFVLLAGAGLLGKSFTRVMTRDVYFDTQRLLTFDLQFPVSQFLRPIGTVDRLPYFAVGRQPAQTFERVAARLRQLPGVEGVAGASIPLLNAIVVSSVAVVVDGQAGSVGDRRPEPALGAFPANLTTTGESMTAAYFLVTPRFFTTIGAPLLAGRDFEERDISNSRWVAIVNESAARRFWPGGSPIGKLVRARSAPDDRPREVIGVVRDIPLTLRQKDERPVIYTSYLQQPGRFPLPGATIFGRMTFMVRASGDPMRLLPPIRRAIAEIAPDRPVADPAPMGRSGWTLAQRPTYIVVLGVFAITAMVLAAIGIYGVMSYTVAGRTREIGLRMTLGAGVTEIVRVVSQQLFLILAAGLALAVPAAIALAALLTPQLWDVTPYDPATFVTVLVLVLGVAALACAGPLRRATRVNLSSVLRTD